MSNSIGLIESRGLVALIEAADVILKNSPVQILGIHKLENGLISLALSGNSDYVKAAVESGVDAGKRVGEIYSFSVIENPDIELIKLFGDLFPEFKIEPKADVKINQSIHDSVIEEKVEITEAVKPLIRTESKREKSKPLLITRIDNVKKLKKIDEKKSEKKDTRDLNKKTDKLVEEKTEEQPNSKTVSTIERLRLEALGFGKKNKSEETEQTESENSVDESNKINLALEPQDIDFTAINKMNVHKLRNYARKFPEFPIKGREISRANRDELVKLFKTLSK